MNSGLIEKIRKLRALSLSENVHEAAAAAAAAERLIQEHNVAEAELEAASDAQVEAPTREDLAEVGTSSPTWKLFLSSALEKAHGCAGSWRSPCGSLNLRGGLGPRKENIP